MNMIDQIHKAGLADGFNNPNVGPYAIQQEPVEFAQLVEILRQRFIHTYLQVGSAAGGSERFICEKANVKTLHIIDLGTHEHHRIWQEVNRPALVAQGVEIMEHWGDSHEEPAEQFLAEHGLKYDLIGIDGEHTPAGVRMDWKLIEPCLKPGALVFLHDIAHLNQRLCDHGPWEVWCKLKERHKVLLESLTGFGIGLIEVQA